MILDSYRVGDNQVYLEVGVSWQLQHWCDTMHESLLWNQILLAQGYVFVDSHIIKKDIELWIYEKQTPSK